MNQVPLEPGETVTAVFRLHWIAFVPYVLTAAASWLGALTCAWLSATSAPPVASVFALLFFVLLFLVAALLIVGWIVFRSSRLIITNLNVFTLIQRTPWAENFPNVTLASVTNATGQRLGLLATFLNYGSVSIQTIGGSLDFVTFGPVGAPANVALEIKEAHEEFVKANPGQSV